MEVYIDEMVVKRKKFEEHILNLTKVFEILWHYKLCLNMAKCMFGVGYGKFLGYMITCRGIKVNPDQISVIQQHSPPRNSKEM